MKGLGVLVMYQTQTKTVLSYFKAQYSIAMEISTYVNHECFYMILFVENSHFNKKYVRPGACNSQRVT